MVGESGDVGDVDLEIVDSSFDPHPRSSSPHSLAGLAPPLLTGAEVESGLSSGVGPNLFRSKWIRCGCEVAIIVVAIIIAFVVGRASNSPGDTSAASDSAPVILVSFDGMRADYIDLAGSDRTPNFQSMKSRRDAVWAKGMRPSFPSLTFPNHYTLVTGMHPESHGIVGNYIYDPTTQKYFIYKDPATHSSEWWQAIPLWVTSQLYSIASGTIFWAGSEAEIDGRRPSVWLPYDGTLSNDARIDQLFEWIDSGKCTLCLIYFSDVDSAGHSFGAASPEALSATAAMDVLVGRIRSELRSRDLDTSASLVLVSDHGMATVTDSIYLDDYIDINSYGLTHQDLGAITNIWLPEPINATLTQQILANLSGIPHITCWAKESTPPKYHFGTSPRIAPINCLCDLGYVASSRSVSSWRFPASEKGCHGYDPALPEMHAIFFAQSPALDSGNDNQAAVLEETSNLNIYNLIMHLLHASPTPNNGTLTDFAPYLTGLKR